MRFLLVNPFCPLSENPSPPLGIAFLAAALERAGIQVQVLDLVVYPYSKEKMQRLLSDFQPDIVGSTAVTMSFDAAAAVLKDVKDIQPNILTVMGGPHVTFCARESLETHPELDVCVLGEGEETIVELAAAFESGNPFEPIKGLAYRAHGQIHETEPRAPGIDVDTLPLPARHLLPLARYRNLGMAISMTTSRGCPFHCIFCVGRKMVGSKVRYRRPEAVVDELAYLAGLGFRQINIADDLFTANKKHCRDVCNLILDRGLKVTWTSFARVDTVSLPLLQKMKAAGCCAVSFGVETGNPEIMKTIRKGITLDQVVQAAKLCTEAGLLPHASFILGLPGETPQTLQDSVDFGNQLKSLGVAHGFHLLAPFPGTAVRENRRHYGLKILTDDWTEYHANRAIVETDHVTKEMLDQVAIAWENDFTAYLGLIKERMAAGLATEEEAWPLVNLERVVLTYDMMMDETLEAIGSMPGTDGHGDDSSLLDPLIDRVTDKTEKERTLVADTLTNAFQTGHLIYRKANGLLSWHWVDDLETNPRGSLDGQIIES